MYYNVKEIPEAEFKRMQAYVERAYMRVNRKSLEPLVEIAKVTTNMQDLVGPDARVMPHLLQENYVGWAFRPENYIWMRADRDAFDMRRTAVHEIAHLRSDGDSHGPKWRKTFSLAWAMWLREHGHSWEEIRREVDSNILRYRKWRQYTPQGHYNPYSEYSKKVQKESDETMRAARAICH